MPSYPFVAQLTQAEPNRRTVLMGMSAAVGLLGYATAASGFSGDQVKFFVGTYSSDTARGIYPLTYSRSADSWTLGAPMPAIENVSYGTYDAQTKRYYLLNEKSDGRVAAYGRDWKTTGEVSSHGRDPCYIAIDPTGGYVAVANYSSGNIAVYKTGTKGELIEPPVIRQNAGKGPKADRQEGPHAHWVQFHGDYIYSVDLGTDQVLGYGFNAATGAVGDAFVAYQAPAGSGPRHMAFHKDGTHAFIATELSSQVIALRKTTNGCFEAIQTLSALPSWFTGESFCAHILLNQAGDRLYVSNRGDNSIAVFTVAAGHLDLLQIAPTLGNWPRFFLLREDLKRVVVAHQRGNDLVVFEIKPDGTLQPKNQTVSVSQPVFIAAMA